LVTASHANPKPTTDAKSKTLSDKKQPSATNKAGTKPKASQASKQPPSSKKGPGGIAINKLKKKLEGILKKYKAAGFGLALVSRKQIWAGGVGMADIKAKKPVTKDTLFRVGSISKSFLVLGFLRLVHEKKVKLQEPIRKWTKGKVTITNKWAKTDPIRLVHLLEHTSGFDDMHFNEFYNTKDAPELPMLEVLKRGVAARRVRWRPGTWVSYSNPGYGVAGYILEQLTGQKFEDYLQTAILAPLGMKTASFHYTDAVKKKLAQGYQGILKPVPATYRHIYHRPAGSLHASPREMAAFVQFLLNRGKTASGTQLLPASLIDRMERPTSALHVRKGQPYGFGPGNYRSVKKGIVTFGHNGGIDGFISTARYSKEHGLGYVLLANQSGDPRAFRDANKALAAAIASTKPHKGQPTISLPAKTLKQYEGGYQQIHMRNQTMSMFRALAWIRLKAKKDHLVMQKYAFFFWSDMGKFYPVGKGLFQKEGHPAPTLLLTQHKHKPMAFLTSAGFEKRWTGWPHLVLFSLVGGLLLLVAGLAYVLFWGPQKLFMGKQMPYLRARAVPAAASLSLVLSLVSIIGTSYYNLTYASPQAIGFAVFSGLFGILTVASLYTTIRQWTLPDTHIGVRVFCTLHSLGLFAWLVFLWPVVGLRFWAG
jgi:CubicO group peptidase (beta-lactamase class C family)